MNAVLNSANRTIKTLIEYLVMFSPIVSAEYLPISYQYCRKRFRSIRIGNDILFGNIEALGNDFERLNDTQKSLRGSMLIQQKPLKIQQEKRQRSFQLTDKEKSIDRIKNHLSSYPISRRIINFRIFNVLLLSIINCFIVSI